MTKWQRIRNIIIGLVMLFFVVSLISLPDDNFEFLAWVLAVFLLLTGIKYLFYYFTMARFMVSGKAILFLGVIILDLGVFTISITDESKLIIISYLLGIHAFSGILNLLKGISELRSHTVGWKLDLIQGIGNLLMAVSCIVFRNSTHILVYLYCAGLTYPAIMRITSAFRRSAIVYIP